MMAQPNAILCRQIRTIVAVACLMLAACGTSSTDPDAAATGNRGGAKPRSQGSAVFRAPALVKVPMDLRNGVPVVHCTINQKERLWMIVDTGSQTTLLERSTAESCALRPAFSSQRDLVIAGISGDEPVWRGLPESMAIGPWEWSGVPCLVRTRQSSVHGPGPFGSWRMSLDLIGMDVLRDMCWWCCLDFRNARFEFGFEQPFRPSQPERAQRVPMLMRDGLPYVELNCGGVTWWALVDTGASSVVEVDAAVAARLGLQRSTVSKGGSRVGVGSVQSGSTRSLDKVRLPSLGGLGAEFTDVQANLVPDQSKIGAGLLQHYRVTLDFKQSCLWLER